MNSIPTPVLVALTALSEQVTHWLQSLTRQRQVDEAVSGFELTPLTLATEAPPLAPTE